MRTFIHTSPFTLKEIALASSFQATGVRASSYSILLWGCTITCLGVKPSSASGKRRTNVG